MKALEEFDLRKKLGEITHRQKEFGTMCCTSSLLGFSRVLSVRDREERAEQVRGDDPGEQPGLEREEGEAQDPAERGTQRADG